MGSGVATSTTVGRRVRLTFGVALAVAVVASAGTPGAASARVSHARATAVALRALGGGTVLALPQALQRGATVVDAGPGPNAHAVYVRHGVALAMRWHARVARLRAPAWLYWRDLSPHVRFPHPSRLVLVDERTGRVVRRMSLAWWPVIDGHPAAFEREPGPEVDPRFLVSRARALDGPPARAASVQPTQRGVPAIPADLSGTGGLTPGLDLSHDCMIRMINRADPQFTIDDVTWAALAKRLSIPYRDAETETSLDRQAAALQAAGCRDVVLVIAGHGLPLLQNIGGSLPVLQAAQPVVLLGPLQFSFGPTGTPGVVAMTASVPEVIDEEAVLNVMRRHPGLMFKLIVDACYSGRWQDIRRRDPDPNQIAVIATSAAANQPSLNSDAIPQPGGVVLLTPSPFGFYLPSGIASWATDATAVSLDGGNLAKGIARAFDAFPSGEATERGPTISTSVSAQLTNPSPACAAFDAWQGTCTAPAGKYPVRVSLAFPGDGDGTVAISPGGGTMHAKSPPPGVGNPYFHDVFFFVPLGAKLTLTATAAGGDYFHSWSGVHSPSGGCSETGTASSFSTSATCSFSIPAAPPAPGHVGFTVDAYVYFVVSTTSRDARALARSMSRLPPNRRHWDGRTLTAPHRRNG